MSSDDHTPGRTDGTVGPPPQHSAPQPHALQSPPPQQTQYPPQAQYPPQTQYPPQAPQGQPQPGPAPYPGQHPAPGYGYGVGAPYPYASPGDTVPNGAAAAETGRARSRSLGLIALIAAAGILLWQGVHVFLQVVVLSQGDFDALPVLGWVGNTIEAVLAIAAITCGAIGLAQRNGSKALPGIGLGAGIVALGSVISWGALYPVLSAVFY